MQATMAALTRSLIQPLVANRLLGCSSSLQCRSISVRGSLQALNSEWYREKNEKLNRPLSPHLTIYKPQLTSMLSITHRITGGALGVYTVMLGAAGLACPESMTDIVSWIDAKNFSMFTLALAKFTLAFPFAYHTANGVRHLLWDSGKFLTIRDVYFTGYAMVGSAALLTIGLLAL